VASGSGGPSRGDFVSRARALVVLLLASKVGILVLYRVRRSEQKKDGMVYQVGKLRCHSKYSGMVVAGFGVASGSSLSLGGQ
jgi:hypothetical protein